MPSGWCLRSALYCLNGNATVFDDLRLADPNPGFANRAELEVFVRHHGCSLGRLNKSQTVVVLPGASKNELHAGVFIRAKPAEQVALTKRGVDCKKQKQAHKKGGMAKKAVKN